MQNDKPLNEPLNNLLGSSRGCPTVPERLENIRKKKSNPHWVRLSMKDAITCTAERLSGELFPPGYLEKITPLLDIFPDRASRGFILEHQLQTDTAHPDIIFHFSNDIDIRRILASQDPNAKISSEVWKLPAWQNLEHFWQEWHRENSKLKEVRGMWLEFDTGESLATATVPRIPSVFFRVDRSTYAPWIAHTALTHLNGQPLPDPIIQNVKHCFNCLPGQAMISQIGLMLARATNGKVNRVRLYIKRIDKESCLPYLSRIGYPGRLAPLGDLLKRLSPLVTTINLQIEVGEMLSPRIDLECKVNEKKQSWNPFLAWLNQNELCTPDHHRRLTSWSEITSIQQGQQPSFPAFILKYVNHVKVVYQPDKELKAKGYLGVFYA